MTAQQGFLHELKRRNILRAAVLYIGAVWALAQGISQLGPSVGAPEWATRWFLIAAIVGFPFWIAFAWFYAWTPQGFKRESEVAADESIAHSTSRKLDFAIIGVLAVAVVLLLTNTLVWHKGAGFDPPADSIVVLPFANLGDDPKQQYFSDGITEELTGALGQNTGLTVIAWNTASKFAGSKQPPGDVGKALNVAHILAGSIQRAGDQVRVSAELVSTVSGRQLWSAHYDDTLENIFAVQDKISAAIAGALQVKFAGMQAAPTLNPQAHELYLKGSAVRRLQTAASIEAAQRDYQQAIALDPNYADAWAGLARTYLQLSEASTLPLKDALPKLRAAANKALTLDPHNVGALIALGNADANDNRIAQAKAEFRQALALDPSNAAAHLDYGLVLPLKPGQAQQQEAVMLDPKNVTAWNNIATNDQDLGDWPQMTEAAQAMLRLSPQDIDSAFGLAFAYTQMQRGEEAVKAFDQVRPATALDRQLVNAGRLTYQALLKPDLRPKALAALESLRRADISPSSQYDLMQLYLALGGKETAMQMLPGICAAIPVGCNDLAINPIYAPQRGDPRFEKLAKHYTTMTLE